MKFNKKNGGFKTGLTYEKMEKVLKKELEYQIETFRKAKRI